MIYSLSNDFLLKTHIGIHICFLVFFASIFQSFPYYSITFLSFQNSSFLCSPLSLKAWSLQSRLQDVHIVLTIIDVKKFIDATINFIFSQEVDIFNYRMFGLFIGCLL